VSVLKADEYAEACRIAKLMGWGKVFPANTGTAETITNLQIEGGTVNSTSRGTTYAYEVPPIESEPETPTYVDAVTAAKRLRACCQVHKGAFHWTPPNKSRLRRWWGKRKLNATLRGLGRAGRRLEKRMVKEAKTDRREKAAFRQRCDLWNARETAAYLWDAITDVQAGRTAANRKETTKKAWAAACKIVTPRNLYAISLDEEVETRRMGAG